MLITTQKELYALMPTEKWVRVERLAGWIEEEEAVNLVPLLGQSLYDYLVAAYRRLMVAYGDITPATITPDGKVVTAQRDAYVASSTSAIARLAAQMNAGKAPSEEGDDEDGESSEDTENTSETSGESTATQVGETDMAIIGLLRLCQQIAFYSTMAHKAGMMTVSFNEGGGMNVVTADGFGSADKERVKHVTQDAYMSARRSTDTLLMLLEKDARTTRYFTAMWREADYFYYRRDLLFTTARVMNEYMDIGGSREKYVQLVKDVRFCQRTYLQTKVGASIMRVLLEHVVPMEEKPDAEWSEESEGSEGDPDADATGTVAEEEPTLTEAERTTILDESVDLMRSALALYVEARQDEKRRKDLMDEANVAAGQAVEYIKENGAAFGEAFEKSPLYPTPSAQSETAETDCPRPAARTATYDKSNTGNAAFALFAGIEPDPWN